MGASRKSYKAVYFYTRIKIYSFFTTFIRVCLPKVVTRLYLYKLVYFQKKILTFLRATFEQSAINQCWYEHGKG